MWAIRLHRHDVRKKRATSDFLDAVEVIVRAREGASVRDIRMQGESAEILNFRCPRKPADFHITETMEREPRHKNFRAAAACDIDILLPCKFRRTGPAFWNHISIRIFLQPLDLPSGTRQEIQRAILIQQLTITNHNLCPGRDKDCDFW